MKGIKGSKKLTSEELRELYCAPENTDDPESIEFDDDETEDWENVRKN